MKRLLTVAAFLAASSFVAMKNATADGAAMIISAESAAPLSQARAWMRRAPFVHPSPTHLGRI